MHVHKHTRNGPNVPNGPDRPIGPDGPNASAGSKRPNEADVPNGPIRRKTILILSACNIFKLILFKNCDKVCGLPDINP